MSDVFDGSDVVDVAEEALLFSEAFLGPQPAVKTPELAARIPAPAKNERRLIPCDLSFFSFFLPFPLKGGKAE